MATLPRCVSLSGRLAVPCVFRRLTCSVIWSSEFPLTLAAENVKKLLVEFLKDQYRHGKTILVLGASSQLLQKAGIPPALPSGDEDPGLLIDEGGTVDAAAFIAAVAQHRHPARDSDPPLT